MVNAIWGLKTNAIFDVWSVEHILCGFSVGKIVLEVNRRISISTLGLILTMCEKTISISLAFYFWLTFGKQLNIIWKRDCWEMWFQIGFKELSFGQTA